MPRKPISTKLRYQVFERDGFACVYCGARAPNVILHLDHHKPVAAGGEDTEENFRTACSACNQGKGDSVPSEKPKAEIMKHPMIGWAFLSYTMKDGKPEVSTQGIIRDVVATNQATGDCALVDHFEWFMGEYSNSRLIPLTDFTKPWGSEHFYKLFPTLDEQKDYYQRWHGKPERYEGESGF